MFVLCGCRRAVTGTKCPGKSKGLNEISTSYTQRCTKYFLYINNSFLLFYYFFRRHHHQSSYIQRMLYSPFFTETVVRTTRILRWAYLAPLRKLEPYPRRTVTHTEEADGIIFIGLLLQ
jgi:hypothetical protein